MDPWQNGAQSFQQGYPTLPNQFGIGAQIDSSGQGGSGMAATSQTQAGQPMPASPGPAGQAAPYMQEALNQPPAGGATSFDPWAYVGSANSRGS
jgi:hypothetical protein